MKNIIKLMEEAGATVYTNQNATPPVYSFTFTPEQIESLVKRVRNEALDEAAKRFEDLSLYGTKTADTKGVAVILRNLKDPTP
jgi:hypothetical protein